MKKGTIFESKKYPKKIQKILKNLSQEIQAKIPGNQNHRLNYIGFWVEVKIWYQIIDTKYEQLNDDDDDDDDDDGDDYSCYFTVWLHGFWLFAYYCEQ